MGFISSIIDAIKAAFRFIRNLVKVIIRGVLNFAANVVGWFKKIRDLDQTVDTPFLADASQFKEMLKTAPTKNVGIFQGVYNEETDEITHNQYIEADALDDKTREVLGNEPIVVLN